MRKCIDCDKYIPQNFHFRMDSFVLAETFKYLYLLFAESDDLIVNIDEYLFTTEGHLLPLYLSVQPQNYTDADKVIILIRHIFIAAF